MYISIWSSSEYSDNGYMSTVTRNELEFFHINCLPKQPYLLPLWESGVADAAT